MEHYLFYHDTDREGRSFWDSPGEAGEFSVATRVCDEGVLDNAVWVVSAEGDPRQYRLECWFVPEKIDQVNGPDFFAAYFSGSRGVRFPGGIRLDELPDFTKFLQTLGPLGPGFRSIPEEWVKRFYALARARQLDTPTDEYRR
jgi:hypothetical protein